MSPVSTAGDPRGDSPVYYLPGVTERAAAPFDEAKPLCSHASLPGPEGLAPLPSDYAWAQNTTLAQQARWLMDAVGLAMTDEQVRLLILFSLDASAFAEDNPKRLRAGSPGRDPPACETLAELLKE